MWSERRRLESHRVCLAWRANKREVHKRHVSCTPWAVKSKDWWKFSCFVSWWWLHWLLIGVLFNPVSPFPIVQLILSCLAFSHEQPYGEELCLQHILRLLKRDAGDVYGYVFVWQLWALLHFIMPTMFDSHDEFNEWFSKDIENHAERQSGIDAGNNKALFAVSGLVPVKDLN